MDVPVTVAPKAQVTLTKPVREALGIQPGDEVLFSVHKDRAVLTRPSSPCSLSTRLPSRITTPYCAQSSLMSMPASRHRPA